MNNTFMTLGSATFNGKQPKGCWDWYLNFKLVRFTQYQHELTTLTLTYSIAVNSVQVSSYCLKFVHEDTHPVWKPEYTADDA